MCDDRELTCLPVSGIHGASAARTNPERRKVCHRSRENTTTLAVHRRESRASDSGLRRVVIKSCNAGHGVDAGKGAEQCDNESSRKEEVEHFLSGDGDANSIPL